MKATLPTMEVKKIMQPIENLFKDLEEEIPKENRIGVAILAHKPQPKRGKVPLFLLSLETNDLIILNCMVDSGATHNIMPLSVMKTIGLDCTRQCKAGERIFSIDSRSVSIYREIKDLCAKISLLPISKQSLLSLLLISL